jgi:hypothetical protein
VRARKRRTDESEGNASEYDSDWVSESESEHRNIPVYSGRGTCAGYK